MLSSQLFVSLLTVASALAAPQPHSFIQRATTSSKAVSKIDLPTSTLPSPASNLVVKYVVLGYGTQNYTCATTPSDATATPATAGAVATLYDASTVLSMGSEKTQGMMEQTLPPLVLTLAASYGITPDKFPGSLKMSACGHHFFAAGELPTFELHGAKPPAQIQAKKNGDVTAPEGSFEGLTGEGAVDWLQLIDNGLGFSNGTALQGGDVYRVETAGGAAPKTCQNYTGGIQVQYAALYFIYGPK